ncbi:MAG: hypothetical protein RIR18_1207 [Pseudomonadota bacterium]|jgi:two-component system osmolarity sensor histidine kinase EnvZ
MPQSLLFRSFVLISALVMLTTASWLVIFRHADAEPRAKELAQLTTSAVNLVRAALYAAPPETRPTFLNELASREGIRLLPAEDDDFVLRPPPARFFDLLQEFLKLSLGPDTQVALAVNGIPGFWVSFRFEPYDEDQFWIVLPKDRVKHGMPFHLLGWGVLALSMALAVAGLIIAHITRPLRILAEAARRIGQQQMPRLPVNGPAEVQQVMTAFNRMSEDLRQHESERAEVLAGISHDLRTPLARLRLEAEMSLSDEASRLAVVADIEQMDSIIAQFLDYARSEDGEPPEPCNLHDVLSELAEHAKALGKPCVLNFAQHKVLPELNLPPRTLRRCIQNLLENAWKYGLNEGENQPVELSLSTENKQWAISVRDHGIGIPEGSADHLKRAFSRLDTARTNANGTGLGLAIVDRFVRRHGGELTLVNHPEGGLIATIWLPLNS